MNIPILIILFLLVFSMNGKTQSSSSQNATEENRRLLALNIETVVGSIYGADFSALLSMDELIYGCSFDEQTGEYIIKEQEVITKEEWRKIEEAVDTLVPTLEEMPTEEPFWNTEESEKDGDIEMLDGPNYERFCLTWLVGEEEKDIYYFYPLDFEKSDLGRVLVQMIQSK